MSLTSCQPSKSRLAVLASGRGSHLLNLHQTCQADLLPAEVNLVVSNRPDCGAMQIAVDQGLTRLALPIMTHANADDLDAALCEHLRDHCIDWVITAGYLKKIGPLTLAAFENRIINVHPSLLPKYGGRGMYGRHVHEAVIKAGEQESGASIHYVNEHFDSGAIIRQSSVAVDPEMTPEALAARVLTTEHALLILALQGLLNSHDE